MMTVRTFIWITLVCLLLAAMACGGDDASPSPSASPSPTATATRKPTPSPSATPTPVPTPTPFVGIDLTGSQAKQGGFLFVRFGDASATAPVAYFQTTGYAMQQADGLWYTYIGLATDTPIANLPLEVWEGPSMLASTDVSVADGNFTYFSFEVPQAAIDLASDTTKVDQERQLVSDTISVNTPEKYWSGPWIVPTEGEISSTFGEMRSENGGPYFPHLGTDIANDVGTPIYADADGVVAVSQLMQLFGNAVILDHGVGVFTLFGHMDSAVVAAGQRVHRGDLIGYMGQTGYVTGPHLHWEVTVHGTRVRGSDFTVGGADP